MVKILRKKNRDEKSLIKVNVTSNRVTQKEHFKQTIKNIEDENTKLLKLQRQYRNGEVKEEELTQVQIKSLCDLYDKQIEALQKSVQLAKNRILEHRKNNQ